MMERLSDPASGSTGSARFYRILEALARGDSLASVLEALALALEDDIPGAMASILLLDEDGLHLRDGAGPSLPMSYRRAIDGVAIGPEVGSCGTAAFTGKQVVVDDIATDPLWAKYRGLALPLGLRACWSQPIKSSEGAVLGTFAIYFNQPRRPVAGELEQIMRAGFVGGLAIHRDRSDRALRQAQAQAEESRQRMLDAINSLTEGFWLHDREDRLILVNKVVERRFSDRGLHIDLGWTGREIITEQVRKGLFADIKDPSDPKLEEIIQGMLRADGQGIVFQLRGDNWIRMISHRTADGGRACLTIEITSEVRSQRDLRLAKERAEAANFAKSRFLANMSHELRTPLNAILGFSEVIAGQFMGGHVDPTYASYAQDIHFSGMHLKALIDNILDLSKVEAGEDKLHESVVDLSAVFAAARLWQEEMAATAEIGIEVTVTPEDLQIWADERNIRQIAINLLSNAVKFSPRGSGVQLTAKVISSGEIAIEVIDQGVGIAAEEIPEVMRPFGRINNPLQATQNQEGIGLGLPLVKSMVEAHGGKLEIDSTPGKGTTVRVTLPASRLR